MSTGVGVRMCTPPVPCVDLFELRWGRIQVRQYTVDEVVSIPVQQRVMAPLEADRRARVGADPGATGRPADVSRMDLDPVGQRQEPLSDALFKRLGELALLAV